MKGVFLEFTQLQAYIISARPSMFDSKEQLIEQEELDKLLQKGVIKQLHNEYGEFIFPILLWNKISIVNK